MTGLSAFKCAGEIPVRSAADIGVLGPGSPLLREPMLVTDASRVPAGHGGHDLLAGHAARP
jgi:hypothetical protein